MKTSELRLGNLVQYGGTTAKVCQIEKSFFYCETDGNDFFTRDGEPGAKPIPLNEEWLLKFGFEKIKDFDVYTNVWEFKGFMVSLGDYINIHVDWADDGVDNYHSIVGYEELNVHTLQNLYFALTGEELTFKSE